MNILVVKLSSMGDIIFATPCLQALRRHWPEARISVAVNRSFAPLLSENPNIDELRLRTMTRFTKRGRSVAEAAWSGLTHIYPRTDLAIDLHGNFHSAAWIYCSGARRMAGLGENRRGWEFSTPVDHTRHAVDQCASVVERLGVPVTDRRPRLYVAPGDDARVVLYLRNRGLPEREFMVVHPFTAWRSKEWPLERYASVLGRLPQQSAPTIVVTGSEEEAGRAEALCAMVDRPGVVSLAGELTLGESMALWSRARLFLGGDTGALHASAAFGVPSIALFGPTWQAATGPVGDQHKVIQARIPDSHNAYRDGSGGHYIAEIPEDRVFEAVSELLS